MNLQRCENGHFYDADRFDSCPHCNQGTISTVAESTEGKNYTLPLDEDESKIQEMVSGQTEEGVTIGVYGDLQTEPVVGWLVAVEGNHFGEDFKLKAGRNFIGRAANMDVALSGDASISREKHAVVVYEPMSNVFLVQPGDAKELCYLNGKVVLTTTEINAYDLLSVGKTKLLFIPCCSDKFNWDSVKAEEQK